MSPDLEQLLHDTAARPSSAPDPGDLAARGRRRRRLRHGAVGAGTMAAIVAAAIVVGPSGSPSPPEIVDQPTSESATPDPDGGEGEATPVVVDVDPAIAERAAGGRAITTGSGSVWIAGPSRHEDDRGRFEVVRASPDGTTLEAVVEVPAPMNHLVTTDDSVWAVRTGDGALPQNVLVRIDPGTNEVVEQIDLGDFSTAGMVVNDLGELLLIQGNAHPAEAMWVSPEGQVLERRAIPGLDSASAVAYHDGMVAVASAGTDGSAVLVVPEEQLRSGEVVDAPAALPGPAAVAGFAADGLWVAGLHVANVGPEQTGEVASSFVLDRWVAALLTDPVADGFFAVTEDGDVWFGTRGRGDLALVADTGVAANTAAHVGVSLWLVGHEDVVLVQLEDQGSSPSAGDRIEELQARRQQLQSQIDEQAMALSNLRSEESELRFREEQQGEDVDEELAEVRAERERLRVTIEALAAQRSMVERELAEVGALDDPVALARAEATDEDRALTEALVALAREPSPAALDELPFADTVELGLADELLRETDRAALADPSAWVLDLELFRAYTGPFSALDVLTDDTPTQTLVGEHPHCASPPVPPPPGYGAHRRVSLQPIAITSCLEWWTVDLFVAGDGRVEAVTLDLYEP